MCCFNLLQLYTLENGEGCVAVKKIPVGLLIWKTIELDFIGSFKDTAFLAAFGAIHVK